jgi:hypothetical protein
MLYVATPAVLNFLELDPATIDPHTNFLVAVTLKTDNLVIPDLTSRRSLDITHVQRVPIPRLLLGYPDASNNLGAALVRDRRRAPPLRLETDLIRLAN